MNNYSAVCYSNTFLNQVIIRCDFLEVLPTDKVFSTDIMKTILTGFPRKGKPQIVRFEKVSIDVPSEANMQPNASRNVIEGVQITFGDQENNKLIISNKTLICEINTYKTFEDILSRITPIIKAVLSKNSVTVIRTGIRYINLFDSEKMKIRKNFFSGNVASSFESKLPVIVEGIECIRTMHTSEYNANGMRLNFRFGMFNPDYPKTLKKDNFALDYDCYYDEPISSSDEVLRYIQIGHDAIQTLFENSITESLRKVYNNE